MVRLMGWEIRYILTGILHNFQLTALTESSSARYHGF